MITLYQESVPFSNKMFDGKISKDQTHTNPVIIPYALNASLGENILETVIYIKNDDQSKYYKNVVISLMTEVGDTPIAASGTLNFADNNIKFSLNAQADIPVDLAFEYPGELPSSVALNNSYMSTYIPVINDARAAVKFSYGYDELSLLKWENASSILLIPTIGTTGLGDTTYIPIRMRIVTGNISPLNTTRDYFIDISFSEEGNVGA